MLQVDIYSSQGALPAVSVNANMYGSQQRMPQQMQQQIPIQSPGSSGKGMMPVQPGYQTQMPGHAQQQQVAQQQQMPVSPAQPQVRYRVCENAKFVYAFRVDEHGRTNIVNKYFTPESDFHIFITVDVAPAVSKRQAAFPHKTSTTAAAAAAAAAPCSTAAAGASCTENNVFEV